LGVSSAALAAASVLGPDKVPAQEQTAQQHPPGDRSAAIPVPQTPRSTQRIPIPTILSRPTPAACKLSSIRFPLPTNAFSKAAGRAKSLFANLPSPNRWLALTCASPAGGVRELHWHTAAEWAYMLYGSARITCIDGGSKSFVTDVKEGDLWYFPPGIPHSIQGLPPDGSEFMLVFDDGNFSEYETVLLTDWMAHTPPDVVAKNFGVAQSALANMPKREKFIFQTNVPGPLEEDQRRAAGALGASPIDFAFRTTQHPAPMKFKSGDVRVIDSSSFKISATVAAAIVTVRPGGMRELHWHPNADEWQFYISGKGRMTVFATGARARTMDFEMGDVGYIQKTLPPLR